MLVLLVARRRMIKLFGPMTPLSSGNRPPPDQFDDPVVLADYRLLPLFIGSVVPLSVDVEPATAARHAQSSRGDTSIPIPLDRWKAARVNGIDQLNWNGAAGSFTQR